MKRLYTNPPDRFYSIFFTFISLFLYKTVIIFRAIKITINTEFTYSVISINYIHHNYILIQSMGVPLGEVIYIAVKPIFKIYLIIGVGIILSKKNILTAETEKNISSIAINVLIPCLAFQKIVSNISNNDIHQISTIVIISFFMMGVGSILCFTFGVIAKCPKTWWGGLICCGLLPNISDLPIAYLQTMESSTIFNDIDKGVSYVMIFLTLQMLVQFNFGAFKLIEMDFHTEKIMIRPNSNDNIDVEKNNGESTIAPSTSTSSISESSNSSLSIQLSNSLHQQPPLLTITADNDPSSSQPLPNSSSYSLTTRSQPMLRVKTSNSARINEPLLSRTLSVPRKLLDNDQIGQQSETIEDIVRVYSKYALLEPIEENLSKSTKNAGNFFHKLIRIIKTTNYLKLFKSILNLWLASTLKIVSITMILSITVAMIPWVQALFIITPQAHLPSAPDGDPPLSFIMDFAGYLGAAEVPFGLLLLGGTIGRLNIFKIPFNVWKVPIGVVFARLFIMPIIGCSFNSKIFKDGLFYNEEILYFISNINFCLPPATSLLYITAFYTPIDNKPHIQMDYLALIYILHYILLVICLPFTTTYTMKVPLHL